MSNYTPQDSVPVVAHKLGMMEGRAKERALIVAWLRAQNTTANLELEDDLAKDIEAGEHLK
jgi:hypothetical protein